MAIGPNEDGAELYRLHLEAMTCETCGGCKEDRELHIFQSHEVIAALRSRVAVLEKVARDLLDACPKNCNCAACNNARAALAAKEKP